MFSSQNKLKNVIVFQCAYILQCFSAMNFTCVQRMFTYLDSESKRAVRMSYCAICVYNENNSHHRATNNYLTTPQKTIFC